MHRDSSLPGFCKFDLQYLRSIGKLYFVLTFTNSFYILNELVGKAVCSVAGLEAALKIIISICCNKNSD